MNIQDALVGVRRLFLDTAPVIYHIEGNPAYQPLTDIIFSKFIAECQKPLLRP